MTRSLQHAVDEALSFIEQALEHIRAGEGSELELQNLRAYLLNILELVERDPGIEAATDDLYASAKELALGRDKGARMARLMESSMLRLRERLAHALPRSADGARAFLGAIGPIAAKEHGGPPSLALPPTRASLGSSRRSQLVFFCNVWRG